MKRLTQWFAEGVAGIATDLEEKYTAEELIDILVQCLAPYEDTGMEAKEIKDVQDALSPIPFGRFREIMEAERGGRLAVPPCKIGDTVYWVHSGKVTDCRVYRNQVNKKGLFIGLRSTVRHGDFPVECIGKTVFLSREEAEEALRKEEAEHG